LAGVLAATGKLSLPLVILFGCIGALAGNSLGYWIGERLGPRVFTRPKSRLFNPENVTRAQSYFDRYGALTLIIARFVPFVRTFAATLAGVGKMNYWRFQLYNVIGGVLWCTAVSIAGYFLGSLIPDLDRYILLVIAAVVVAAFIPLGVALFRRRKSARATKQEPSHHS
jgi:membrane-associated protein